MKNIALLAVLIIAVSGCMISGCAVVQHESTITETFKDGENIVTVESQKKEDITYARTASGDVTITYSSQTKSLLARLVNAISSWAAGMWTRMGGE